MSTGGLLIGTAILWLLKALVVTPLAQHLTQQKLAQPAYTHLGKAELSEVEQATLQRLTTQKYILADVLVLGSIGFIAGLLGYWFIGIAWKGKEWPGLITFIVAGLLGVALRTG